jgi:A/G-specific adenine glycosylase
LIENFAERLIGWQQRHGRHDLPWQRTRDPYRVWLSEIMLQQTQVATVLPYYERFLARFPTLTALAAAPVEEVMASWSGLGYYARARNLHRCAQAVVADHGGRFPEDPAAIAALPGIGRSTANAIAVFCFGARVPILDGNVKRVLCRGFGIDGFPGEAAVERRLWQLAEELLPEREIGSYIQGQMDLGATVCTRGRPRCAECPMADGCVARIADRIADLPGARPAKVLPQRESTVLVLVNDGAVLLERRPPSGIWGGLLSLPELAEGTEPAALAAQLGAKAGTFAALPARSHSFTHFRLSLRPLASRAAAVPGAAEPGRVWWPLAELDSAGLPAPIRRLLCDVVSSGFAAEGSHLPPHLPPA